jgi:CheY-like chemotaxis protein
MQSILLLDDDVLTRWVMGDALRDAGYAVIDVSSGAEAVELIDAAAKFDLLVTDVNLPGALSGMDVVAQWRDVLPQQPIIYSSGDPRAIHGTLLEREYFLQKPFSSSMLLGTVESALQSGPAGQAATPVWSSTCKAYA